MNEQRCCYPDYAIRQSEAQHRREVNAGWFCQPLSDKVKAKLLWKGRGMGLQNTSDQNKRFLLGIVGQGPALQALTRILEHVDFASAFPRVTVGGWVPLPETSPAGAPAAEVPTALHRCPVFSTVQALFDARPDIVLALDVSPDCRHVEALRRYAPQHATIASSEAVMEFCLAAEEGKLAIAGGENLRKVQRLFALLVDQTDGDILILDYNGTILDINQHAAESRGLSRSQIIGRHYSEFDDSLQFCLAGDETLSPYARARTTGKKAENKESEVISSGRVRYTHTLCFPVSDAFGNPSQFLYIRRDVTEQQYLEQRLQQAEKMAAIGELSTYLAHEIRNPIFSIGGFANSLLRNSSLTDGVREKARIIYEESRRLDAILSNLLNFARPTEQTLAFFNPEPVARQTIELMTMGSGARGINVTVDIAPNLPEIEGNPENLKQCLINLLKNAIEAMPEGGSLTLRAFYQNTFVQIDVLDTGGGIEPELHDQVFNPFYTTKKRGAGLGLAMTRKVIEDMGGKVLLSSQKGEGACVSLLLPVAPAVNQDDVQRIRRETDSTS